MPHLIGKPRWFQDCEPGELLRVFHRGTSRFAFAVCGNANGAADKVAVLDEVDAFPLIDTEGNELVISYGRGYRIQEGMLPDSLSISDLFQAGRINWRPNNDEQSANLMVSADKRKAYVDIDTGRISMPRGSGSFSMAGWSVILTAEDGSDIAEVFQAP